MVLEITLFNALAIKHCQRIFLHAAAHEAEVPRWAFHTLEILELIDAFYSVELHTHLVRVRPNKKFFEVAQQLSAEKAEIEINNALEAIGRLSTKIIKLKV